MIGVVVVEVEVGFGRSFVVGLVDVGSRGVIVDALAVCAKPDVSSPII